MARSIDHAWKQAAPHRDVVPLNARSAETLLHDNNTAVDQQCWTSTSTSFVPRTELSSTNAFPLSSSSS